MSRNKIQANRRIFERLEAQLPDGVVGVDVGPLVRRWLETNAEESRVLEQCTVHQIVHCLPGKLVIGMQYEGQGYIALPEVANPDLLFMQGVLRSAHNHAGLVTILLGEADYPVRHIPDLGYQVLQNIFGIQGGYKLETIAPYFEDYDIWEVSLEAFPMSRASMYRVYGGRLSTVPQSLTLNFSPFTLQRIKHLLEAFPGPMVAEAVFRGLTASHWEHSFLECYRCIERLYTVPYLPDLQEALQSQVSLAQLAKELEERLQWRPKEEEALTRLLAQDCVAHLLPALESFFGGLFRSGSQVNLPKSIYRLRNSIAHWRPVSDTGIPTLNWDEGIGLLCELIQSLYTEFRPVLEQVD